MEISLIWNNKEVFNKKITFKSATLLLLVISEKALLQYGSEAVRCLGGF